VNTATISSSSADVDLARSPGAEQVLGDADLAGIITSMICDDDSSDEEGADDDSTEDEHEPAPRAAHGLCLASKAVLAAVLASVRRVRMDQPLPVLQRMASCWSA
jgi:hypothetical protein